MSTRLTPRRKTSTALAVLMAAVGIMAIWLWLFRGLPGPGGIDTARLAPSTILFDRKGRVLYEILDPYVGRHQPVPLDDIAPWLLQATVATEDASFYSNPGVDARAILRALWINLQGGEVLSGGSTITQQLARNLLLSPQERSERTLTRKLRESILAYRLARTLSKDDILELYLNQTYYGNLAYGVGAAARSYFGKSVRDLDLPECAMLAGLPQAPAIYDPLTNLPAARARQSVVLGLMSRNGFLSKDEAEAATREKLHFSATPFPIRAPHFVMYVWQLLRERFGDEALYRGGLRVITTLDIDLQERAEDIARFHLAQLSTARPGEPPHNVSNAAVVSLDPRTGEILVMLGSPDYFDPRIDGAVNVALMPRQPGSAIKPLTYAAAFLQDPTWTPATMLLDVRTVFSTREGDAYVPVNYDRVYHGPVLLRQALASSLNLVAVKVLDHIGVPALVSLAGQLGIETLHDPQRYGLALTLGGGEVRLLELTAAFGVFASGGVRVTPSAVETVEDASGHVLWRQAPAAERRVIDERVAFWITDILADDSARIPAFGEASSLVLSRPAAVKTGTTTDWRDNWTIGFTPELVTGVWAGNADNSPMVEVSGITGAAPIWHDLMEEALKGQPAQAFPVPEGMHKAQVCAVSGKLPGPWCPRHDEWFISGREPAGLCTMHRWVLVDQRTGELAESDAPKLNVVGQVGVFLPGEGADWAREQLQQAGTRYFIDAGAEPEPGAASVLSSVSISHPDQGATYRLVPNVPLESQRIEISASTQGEAATASRQPDDETAHVQLYADSQLLADLSGPPYSILWQLVPGPHVFVAKMTDRAGKVHISQPVTITVTQ